MTSILIERVNTTSVGSHPVEITGIDPTSHDCLVGTINTPGQGLTREVWNLNGIMRNGSSPLNLDIGADELEGVLDLAKFLKGTPND